MMQIISSNSAVVIKKCVNMVYEIWSSYNDENVGCDTM
jgi:hypothetical protein